MKTACALGRNVGIALALSAAPAFAQVQAPGCPAGATAPSLQLPAPLLAAPIDTGGNIVTAAPPGSVPATGQFAVKNGQFYDPSGQVFKGQGINVFPGQVDAATILSTFPGIKTVRVAATPGTDPAQIDALVAGLTTKGVVVLIEDHSSAGASFSPNGNNVLTGQALADETAWYAGLAAKYKANANVWFGTPNEPDAPGNPGSIAQQEIATYNAIRSTGSNAIVLLEQRGGFTSDFMQPYAADYAKMHNVGVDTHFYGWVPNYSTDPSAIFQAFGQQVANAQSIKSADGQIPVYVGEFGISTTGSGVDANGSQVVQQVLQSRLPSAAWAWNAGSDAVTSGNTVTAFGQQVAAALASQ